MKSNLKKAHGKSYLTVVDSELAIKTQFHEDRTQLSSQEQSRKNNQGK